MSVPSLSRTRSSFAVLVEQERSLSGENTSANEEKQESEASNPVQPCDSNVNKEPGDSAEVQDGDTDIEDGDTDLEDGNEERQDVPVLQASLSKSKTTPPLLRASSRLMSMKRKGKVVMFRELTNEFEYNAGDALTVRGEEDDFYVCRVLEDVPVTAASFQVAWFDRVEPNVYEVSFDDVCHMDCVITRVSLIEKDRKYSLPEKCIKKTKRLLREVLAEERGEEIEEDEEEEEDDIEEDENDAPPAKRTRSSSTSVTPSPRKGREGKQAKGKSTPAPKKGKAQKRKAPTPKKQKKEKPEKKKVRRPGVLIPNDEIELIDVDPTFETREDVSLMPCKQSIHAVQLNDMALLKSLIEDVENVHTVHWSQSPDIKFSAIHYALVNNNKEALEILLDDIKNPQKKRCGPPKITLGKMDTGSYNFHTFGHAVRQIYASRGSREGNNAFLKDNYDQFDFVSKFPKFCLKNESISLDTLKFLIQKMETNDSLVTLEDLIEVIWQAVRCGNRAFASHLIKIALDKDGFGFNFLHKEVLLDEPLSKFRSVSVKKKPYENKTILPLHCACINPNPQYLKDLLSVIPEYNVADRDGFKMVHYASACDGSGPLKVLLSRGVDPNDIVTKSGITPLMIAAKYGREANVEALLTSATSQPDDDDEDDDDDNLKPTVIVDLKSKANQAAIHYAAKKGHVGVVKLLVSHGSNINLQTGSNKGNVTPLMQGAMKGHLDLVKACVELGGKPDIRGKWKKTPLMYAVMNGHSTVAAYLLRLGVDPNSADTSGNTPAHYAAAYGWLHCLKLLVKAGANPNAVNQWKTTPLALAMQKEHIKCAEYILSLDVCDVNCPDDNGLTLLSQTIRDSKLGKKTSSRVSFLVEEKHADVKTVDTNGWTPLHHLAANSIYISPESVPSSTWLGTESVQTDTQRSDSVLSNEDENVLSNEDEPSDSFIVDDDGTPIAHSPSGDQSDDEQSDCDDVDMFGSDSDSDGSDSCRKRSKASKKRPSYSGFSLSENSVSPPPRLVEKRSQASSDIVDILVKCGADVNAVDKTGLTPLMVAILQHNYPMIRKLVDLGADPAVGKNEQGRQVVHIQAEKQNYCDLREMYPEENEPPLSGTLDEQLKQRQAFLEKLVQKANVEMLEIFINHGADLSAADNSGLTPLMIACKTSNLDMFEVLLDHKANPSIGLEDTGRNLLHLLNTVDLKSRGRLAKKILQTMDGSVGKQLANTVDNNGYTPFLLSCEGYASASHTGHNEDHEEVWCDYFKILVEEFGCDVTASVGELKKGEKIQRPSNNTLGVSLTTEEDKANYLATGKFTCLHFFAYPADLPTPPLTLQLLMRHLHRNTDVINSRDLLGRTPLHCAVVRNNRACVEELLKNGAEVDLLTEEKCEEKNQHFSTALILACKPSLKLDIARCLLKWKANPNLVDKNGRSALSYAVTNTPDSDCSHVQLVDALLEAGSDMNSSDNHDRSVFHYAVNTTTGGFEALTEVEDLLLKYGADTTKRDDKGRLPLHNAFVKIDCDTDSSLSDPVTISSLLVDAMQEQTQDMKTLINHADHNGQTPLHRAAIRGATLCLLHLVKKGADINKQDKDGNTAFSLAIRGGHNSCAMSLIQQGANPKSNVVTPVTKQQMEDYENQKKKDQWIWKELHDRKVPQPIIKSAFYEIVQRNWQGVAYLMLDVAGLDFILAIKAVLAAKKVDLAWTLLRKQKKDVSLKSVDDKGRNALHLLALNLDTYSDVVKKIAVHVLQRGVSPSSVDNHGAIPLHYAASNGNTGLCELLLRYNPSTINTVLDNQSAMTPIACCFDGSSLTSRHGLIESMIKSKPRTLDVCYKVGEGKETTTPFIEACVNQDEFLIKLLLENHASVNFAKANGRTPLMEVVRENELEIAKMILYGSIDRQKWAGTKTKVDLTAVDDDGKTVVHHCVNNREYGSSENVDMLKLLAKCGAPLDAHDNSGRTPLDYAKRQQSGKMKKAILELMKRQESQGVDDEDMETDIDQQVPAALWEGPEPDIDADSEAMLAEAKTGDEEPDWDPSKPPPVDKYASVNNGEVHIDPDTGIPYDILMTKVDTKYGLYGLNVFYKMQVVHQKGKDLWVLLNRWGRIGDPGQHQRTPFMNPEDATAEFKKIFRSKTGNDWNEKESFKKMPKKYSLVLPDKNPEFKRKKAAEVLRPFDLKKCPPSLLPEEIQTLMKEITNVSKLKESLKHLGTACNRTISLDENYMPFGRLSTATIDEAKDVLLQIKEILSDIENVRGNDEKYEKVYELSNVYYTLIPMANYTFDRIKPLNRIDDVDSHLNNLFKLTELAFISKVMLAAQYRDKEINPLDYCYRALGAHIELMDHNTDECQLILKAVHCTSEGNRHGNNPQAKAVYRLSRPMENERMTSCGVHSNHCLLWHGTKATHLMSILKEGLRIDPPEAVRTGWALGKGIYFSDTINKALQYTDCNRWRSSGPGFVLLCQVALGKQCEFTDELQQPITGPPPNYDSIWRMSSKIPNPADDVTTPYGATFPTGPLVENAALLKKYKTRTYWFTSDSEFVVYNEAQVQQKYLVYFE